MPGPHAFTAMPEVLRAVAILLLECLQGVHKLIDLKVHLKQIVLNLKRNRGLNLQQGLVAAHRPRARLDSAWLVLGLCATHNVAEEGNSQQGGRRSSRRVRPRVSAPLRRKTFRGRSSKVTAPPALRAAANCW